jgi:hypothetical protein
MCAKLGDANSATLTLCVLRTLQSFILNLAKLCEAYFAHESVGELTLQGLLCEVTLQRRNVGEITLQCLCNGLLYHPSAQGNSSLGMTGIRSPDSV